MLILLHTCALSSFILIVSIQLACGYEYTNKLHRMFTDMTISTDLNVKFSNSLKTSNISVGINFSLLVLQVRLLLNILETSYKHPAILNNG